MGQLPQVAGDLPSATFPGHDVSLAVILVDIEIDEMDMYHVMYHLSGRGPWLLHAGFLRKGTIAIPAPNHVMPIPYLHCICIMDLAYWGTQVPRSLHLLHSRKSEGIHIVPHCSGNLSEMFWGQRRCTTGHQAIKEFTATSLTCQNPNLHFQDLFFT